MGSVGVVGDAEAAAAFRGNEVGIQKGGEERAFSLRHAQEAGPLDAPPDLKAERTAERLRADEQGIEDHELRDAHRGAAIGHLRVVFVGVPGTHDLEDERGRTVPGVPQAHARELLGRGRRGLHDAQIRIEADARRLLEDAHGDIAEHGGVATRARDPALEQRPKEREGPIVPRGFRHGLLRDDPRLREARHAMLDEHAPFRGGGLRIGGLHGERPW